MSFYSIFSDARNFIRNNLTTIFITIAILSVLSQLMSILLLPDLYSIAPIKSLIDQTMSESSEFSMAGVTKAILEMSDLEQQQLLSVIASYLFKLGMLFFFSNLIIISTMLALISILSVQQFTLTNLLKNTIAVAPHISIFMLLAIPFFYLLSIILSILKPLAIPLGIIAIILYLSTYMIFLAVIITPSVKARFIERFKITLQFFKQNFRLILPIMMIWLTLSFLLNNVSAAMSIDSFLISVALNIVKSFLTFITICYLYRLYCLSNKILPHDAGN